MRVITTWIEVDRDAQGRVYLKAWTEVDKFSVVLREADQPGMDFMGFKCLSEAVVDQRRAELIEFGCEVEDIPADELKGCGHRVRFVSPSGHRFELFATKEQTGKWGVGNHNPEAWPRGLKGMQANRFDHCLLYGPELVLRAADLISMTDTSIDIGPTRHGLTHGQTIYFFDPSGNRNEVFAGGDYHYPDHEPVTWGAGDLGKAIFYHDRQLNERFLTVLT